MVRLSKGTTSLKWGKDAKRIDRLQYGVGHRLFSRQRPEMRELLMYYSLRALARMVTPPLLVTRSRTDTKVWPPSNTRKTAGQKANWLQRIVENKTCVLQAPDQERACNTQNGEVADSAVQTSNIDSSPLIAPTSTIMRSSLITTLTHDPSYVRDLLFVALSQVSRMAGTDVVAARARLGLLGQDAVSYAKEVLPLIPHLGNISILIHEAALSSLTASSSVITHPTPHTRRVTTKTFKPRVGARPSFLPGSARDEVGDPLTAHPASKAVTVFTHTFKCGCVQEQSLAWDVAPIIPSSVALWYADLLAGVNPLKRTEFVKDPNTLKKLVAENGRVSYSLKGKCVTDPDLLVVFPASKAVPYAPSGELGVSEIPCNSVACLRASMEKLEGLLVG